LSSSIIVRTCAATVCAAPATVVLDATSAESSCFSAALEVAAGGFQVIRESVRSLRSTKTSACSKLRLEDQHHELLQEFNSVWMIRK